MPSRLIRTSFSFARPVLVALAVCATVVAWSLPASAHGDEGTLTVTVVEQTASDRVRVEVGIVYTNDNDPAEEATVSATLTGSDGQVVGPVDLPRTSGSLYGAEIDVPGPGAWQVAVTASSPAATGEATVEVVAAPDPTDTTAAPDTTIGDRTDTSIDNQDGEPLLVASPPADDGGDDSGTVIVIAGLVGLVVIAAVAGAVIYRRRAAGPPAS